jgi:hypothetical protein
MIGFDFSLLTGSRQKERRARSIQNRPVQPFRSTMECFITGYRFHEGEEIEHLLHQGAEVTLVRETTNPVNTSAVAVYFQKKKLGYVTSDISNRLAPKMDKGYRVRARVKHFQPDEECWSRLFIGINA